MNPTFDHLDPGTPEEAWARVLARAYDQRPLRVPDAGAHLLVVAAHPDDETLGAGGLIAAAARAGAQVTVLVATDGEGSHPGSETYSPGQLAALRRRELYAAMAVLAPSAQVILLGLPDGGLTEHYADLCRALEPTAASGCTHVVTPWESDGHPDHEACGQAGAEIARRHRLRHWQYPIWAWHWADPGSGALPDSRLHALALDGEDHKAKVRALECHVSQHQPLSAAAGDEAILNDDMRAHFERAVEIFVLASEKEATTTAYFDDLYARDDDPWGLADRFYEQRKRAAILAALTRPRFGRAFEPGCATGLLTRELARRCDEVIAWDVADAALRQARDRLEAFPNASLARGRIPDKWPPGTFDLILLSEVGYYCPDLHVLAHRVHESLADDGVLLACHWRHPAPKHPHGAGEVHAVLGKGHHLVVSHVEDDFLLQVWTRTGQSVAAAEGIIG